MHFQDIALPHFQALYNFALHVAGNPQDAEDLVQETYLRAFRKFDQFDYGTNIKAWMFRILRNIAIDNLRKKDALLAGKNEPYDDEFQSVSSPSTNMGNIVDLKNGLAKLPEKYRIVVLLKDVEGFSYQEIADILSFPLGTVMSRLYRGRRELFSLLTGQDHLKTQNKIVMLRQ
jgi:RNA polymerase sigma-70 factor (ECF subfamily)